MTEWQDKVALLSRKLSGNDADYCQRMWQTPQSVYRNRLKAIGFCDKSHVLDAGCGMGQWLPALSELNENSVGLESQASRVEFLKQLQPHLLPSVKIFQGELEAMPFEESSFDAIFCNSVIYCTDYPKVLEEFHRVLRPGGQLYLTSNGIGWYLYSLHSRPRSKNFFPDKMVGQALDSTLDYFKNGNVSQNKYPIILPSSYLKKELVLKGFKIEAFGGEGSINLTNVKIDSFFQGEYHGHEGVYEFLANRL